MTIIKSKNPGAVVNSILYDREDYDYDDRMERSENALNNLSRRLEGRGSGNILNRIRNVRDFYINDDIFNDIDILKDKVVDKIGNAKVIKRFAIYSNKKPSKRTQEIFMSIPSVHRLHEKKRIKGFDIDEAFKPNEDIEEIVYNGFCDEEHELTFYGGIDNAFDISEEECDIIIDSIHEFNTGLSNGRDITNI